MTSSGLFQDDAPNALRQPKTDRLILERFLKKAAGQPGLRDAETAVAHQILIKWADLESSGQLAQMGEAQLQGEFLSDVFDKALGYTPFSQGTGEWTRGQHISIAGQTPDAVLGKFRSGTDHKPLAVIELKGPRAHLDRDRSNGRTAIQQLWEYLNNTDRECRWGIASNMVSFRLYERESTMRRYEHFTLQSLRDPGVFQQFRYLFHRNGLIEGIGLQPPRAIELLKRTNEQQRKVGDELYELYSAKRLDLIKYLREEGHLTDLAIEMAQRLFDRVIFIAFCEDRDLLNKDTIEEANRITGFRDVTNPRWRQFKSLFRFIDVGNADHGIPPYNGGLFAKHPVDDLDLPDAPWTDFFKTIGGYDFREEINLDVLGHLFEKSITELDKLRSSALFEGKLDKIEQYAQMPQSAKRKQLGIYYTPPELTDRIVRYTVEELIVERWADLAQKHAHNLSREEAIRHPPDSAVYWREAIEVLRSLKIVDPACGSGAFLFQAYEALEQRYLEAIGHLTTLGEPDAGQHFERVPAYILNDNLYGVDLSPEAVEITQLALWIRSATRGKTLATLSRNIVHGNSLVHDAAAHPSGFDWKERFPEVFNRPNSGGGFDCVIGNPPWERLDLSEREFFSLSAPRIATATTGAKRKTLLAQLRKQDPLLFAKFEETKANIDRQREYCRMSGVYPLTGKGRTNTYAVFAELAFNIVAPNGLVGLLTPSGIAMQKTTKDFFAAITDSERLIRLFEFDNRRGSFFPEVHPDTQFVILNFGGAEVRCKNPDFIFGVLEVDELQNRSRHLIVTGSDIRLVNPNTRTCPIFHTRRDAELTKAVYRRVPVLINQAQARTGNPWDIRFKQGLFNQTTDSGLFAEVPDLRKAGFKLVGNRWKKGRREYLPLYEAKMIEAYDHRFGTVYEDKKNWINQGQTYETTLVQHTSPEYLVLPRFWATETEIRARLPETPSVLLFRDITNPSNARTMISAFGPSTAGFINTLPIVLFSDAIAPLRQTCLQANFGCFALDYFARNKVHGRHMNFFALEQLPVLPPDTYDKACPWKGGTTLEKWISERVLKLSCTAEDMLPLAEACGFTGGSFQREYGGKLHKWDPQDRARLMAELDAAFFILYGIDRDDAEYMLSTFSGVTDGNDLLPGTRSTAQLILETYDMLRMQMTSASRK